MQQWHRNIFLNFWYQRFQMCRGAELRAEGVLNIYMTKMFVPVVAFSESWE